MHVVKPLNHCDPLSVLSAAKLNAISEIMERTWAHGAQGSVYEAMEAWRTAANAYDKVFDATVLRGEE